ncbi:D-alanyl-D-alanine carboxypeptidase/D-alanyl-D-alanine-endopeptidase [Sediminibacterium ginsengisoli]|uniref:D-alanyl-D-alanine carboxypeptidase / D-alanyl-D-alanine-endopeptidase (Penicillin-binding protein 4) n=1 Tax=Sediminibacterium ginsengisoli TaxID=413434 RepID=A0A1T4JT97_9BACT|nr:D-alanyl-D-alanine carboxypeptidase [Sediminibacterium ginsengisoli]SJZ33324.1 D-alanyl-D-alanine carboxypeptidase / D-alanyl-D-alanine-endopeptidase (penicillin-binding protein 4) [Sediminibacterium ginsengisoli]
MKNARTGWLAAAMFVISSCSVQKKLERQAKADIFSKPELSTAHVGISIYDPAQKKFIYDHQGNKYFVPASNTKIATVYVAMKYLGDSLPALKVMEYEDRLVLTPTGDPTLLHPDYPIQPVVKALAASSKALWNNERNWREKAFGLGWSWSDYNSDYMAERSALPIYGNVIRFSGTKDKLSYSPSTISKAKIATSPKDDDGRFISDVRRDYYSNNFSVQAEGKTAKTIDVPFITSQETSFALLSDTIHKKISSLGAKTPETAGLIRRYTIYSRPTDSMLKPMMHRSDNFFAEQSLLMVSNVKLGSMNDAAIIDTLLKTDYSDLPQKPRWVDGSGLSRYNLFTPQDFVTILMKIKNEFEWNRITDIFATGGTGTLGSFYKELKGKLYAKTGTLSGQVALSGYLITKKNNTLVFSVLVNNHQTTASAVRKAVESFLMKIYETR